MVDGPNAELEATVHKLTTEKKQRELDALVSLLTCQSVLAVP